ncbi:MAG: hypothetical protein WBC78_13910 [Candidatus Sulfotelmatobacter sp.]
MYRRIVKLALICLFAGPNLLSAQDFKILDRMVQVHGFASEGFIYTNDNNWLTMNTSQGSAAFTDFGLNISAPVTDKFRVGAQVYDRNLGQLGQYHPSLDWAVADYRLKNWLGIRGGKVKTVFGLYSDTQDLDFLHTFALLPQSVYPTDLRDATLAHLGGDIYGTISLRHRLGDLSYTAYAGHRSDSLYGGGAYLEQALGVTDKSAGGPEYGADLRWETPLKGLLAGVSRLITDYSVHGVQANHVDSAGPGLSFDSSTKAGWTNQFYGEYTVGRLRVDAEYRRYYNQSSINITFENVPSQLSTDVRGWYVSGAYRVGKRLQFGSYYSRYSITAILGGPEARLFPNQTDTDLPANHVYDKVITARIDLNKFWNVKVEGHFMNGYGLSTYPDGFYPQVNPQGFKPNTNALVIKTSFHF